MPETFKYIHHCGCQYEGTIVEVRPRYEGSVYYLTPPSCEEKHVELEKVDV